MRWTVVFVGWLSACSADQTLFDLSDRQGREVGFLVTATGEGEPRRTFGPIGLQDGELVFGERPDLILRENEESAAMILWDIDRLSEIETGLVADQLHETRLRAEPPPEPPEIEFASIPRASVLSRPLPEDTIILAEPPSLERSLRDRLDMFTLQLPVDPEHCDGNAVPAFVPFMEQSELQFPGSAPDLDDVALITESLVVAMSAGGLYVLRRGAPFDTTVETERTLASGRVRPGAIFRSISSLGPPDETGRFTIAAALQGAGERVVALIDATSEGFQDVRTATIVSDLSLTHVAGRPDGRYLVTSDEGAGVFGTADGALVRTRWSDDGDNAENERATAIDDPRFTWLVDTRLTAYVYDEAEQRWIPTPYPGGELFPRIGGHTGFRTPSGDLQFALGSRRGVIFGGPLENLDTIVLTMPPRFAPCTPAVDDPSPPLALNNSDVTFTAGSLFFAYDDCNAIMQVRPESYCVSLVFPEREGFRELFRIERLVARDGVVIASGEGGRVLTARVPQ